MASPDKQRYFINSLARGLSFLATFSSSKPQLGLAELAEANNMTLGTCTRYIFTLNNLSYVVRDPVTKKYALTPKILSLGLHLLKNMELRDRVLPYMIETTRDLDITTQCAILDETEIVYVERVRSKDVVNLDLRVGSRLPCYCTALGKAILAFEKPDKAAGIVNNIKFVPHTPYTITDKVKFGKELELTRRRGYATNDQELTLGLKTLAAPVFKGALFEGAIGMSYPINRVENNALERVFIEKLRDISAKTSI